MSSARKERLERKEKEPARRRRTSGHSLVCDSVLFYKGDVRAGKESRRGCRMRQANRDKRGRVRKGWV